MPINLFAKILINSTKVPNFVCVLHNDSSGEKLVEGKKWGRRLVSGALISVTAGIALSALDDLAIYHACTRFLNLFCTIHLLYAFEILVHVVSTDLYVYLVINFRNMYGYHVLLTLYL